METNSPGPQRVLRELMKIPNVGEAVAKDLLLLGFSKVEELRGKDPYTLYRRLEELTVSRQDPCVLDTFMAVVHFADTGERVSWWKFTESRKSLIKEKALEETPRPW